jgi:hypothetical protein
MIERYMKQYPDQPLALAAGQVVGKVEYVYASER